MSAAQILLALCLAPADPVPVLHQVGSDTLRHGSPVQALVYAHDGKTLYSAAHDGTVSRWDLATGKELARFVGALGQVRALALSPDDKTLLTGSSDYKVRIYDTEAKPGDPRRPEISPRALLTPRSSPIESLAFQPNGRSFVVGLEEGRWIQYETESNQEIEGREIGSPVQALTFLPSGKELLSTRTDGGLSLWRVNNPRRLHDFEGETISALALAPDGTRLAVGDYSGELRLLRLREADVVWTQKVPFRPQRQRSVPAVRFTPDGRQILTAGQDGVVRLWDAASGKELAQFAGHRGPVLALAVAPDGKEFTTAGTEGILQRWDLAARKPRGEGLAIHQRVRSFSATPDAGTIVLLVDGRPSLRQGPRLEAVDLPEHLKTYRDLRAALLMPDGKSLLLQSAEGKLLRVSLSRPDEPVEVLPESARATHFALRGRTLAALTSDRQLLLIDLSARSIEPRQLSLEGDLGTAVAVSPDGKYVAAVATSTIVRLWEVASGRLLHELPGPLGGGLAVAFSPDSRLVISAGRDRLVRVAEVSTGKPRQELAVGPGHPTSLDQTADGRFLVVGLSQGSVVLFDFLRGVILDQIDGHRGPLTGVQFQPQSNALFSVAADGVLYLRDVAPILKANQPKPLSLTRQQLEEAWSQLGYQDARTVSIAIQMLVRSQAETLPLLRTRLQPIDPTRVQQYLRELDSDAFETREQALRELTRMGRSIENTLKQHRERPGASLDYRVHIEELLDRIVENKVTPEYLQSLRAIEVLERIGTTEAQQILQKLAGGLKDAEITRQARAALDRLQERK